MSPPFTKLTFHIFLVIVGYLSIGIDANIIYFIYYCLKYLFIYLVAPGLSCGRQAPYLRHACGSSSLTRDPTRIPSIGSAESYHCATREVPNIICLILLSSPSFCWERIPVQIIIRISLNLYINLGGLRFLLY